MANHFDRKPGAVTLNGPVISGYGSLLKIDGVEVLVISPSQDHAEGVADFLNDHAGTQRQGPASHLLIGQPPWYQNTTREHDLQYALNVAGSKIDYMDGPPIKQPTPDVRDLPRRRKGSLL